MKPRRMIFSFGGDGERGACGGKWRAGGAEERAGRVPRVEWLAVGEARAEEDGVGEGVEQIAYERDAGGDPRLAGDDVGVSL